MKRFILIGLFVGLTSSLFSQTFNDQQIVIQMSIDLDDLQPYYPTNKVEDRQPLIIFNNGTVSANLTLTKFDQPVIFMLKDELFFHNKKAYLEFKKFEFSPTKAEITFDYNIEGLTIFISFEKVGNIWSIKNKKLIEK